MFFDTSNPDHFIIGKATFRHEYKTMEEMLEVEGVTKIFPFLKDDEMLASLTKEKIPKKSIFEPEDLENLRIEFESTVIRIAEEMRSGAASAKPIDSKKSPCKFCKMASVCRSKKESGNY